MTRPFELWGWWLLAIGLWCLPMAHAAIWEDIAHSFPFNDTYYATTQPNVNTSYEWKSGINYSIFGNGADPNTVTSNQKPVPNMTSNSSLYFNCTGCGGGGVSYLQYGRFFGGGEASNYIRHPLNWTIECWFRRHNGANESNTVALWGQRTTPPGEGIQLLQNQITGNFTFNWYAQNHTISIGSAPLMTVSVNASWYHVAVTSNEDGWVMMTINGTNVSHYTNPGRFNLSDYTGGGTAFYFGMDNQNFAQDFLLDECRIWNMSRTAANISSLMFTSFEQPESPLTVDTTNYSLQIFDEDYDGQLSNLSGWDITLTAENASYRYNATENNATFNITNLPRNRYVLRLGQINESEYNTRKRILDIGTAGIVSTRVYLVNTTNSPAITIVTLIDETGTPIPNITIQSQRNFVNRSWLPIEEDTTDSNGQVGFYFHRDTVAYRFAFYDNQTFLLNSSALFIYQSTLQLTYARSQDALKGLRGTTRLATQVTVNDTNGNVSVVYLDPFNQVTSSTLTAYRLGANSSAQVCSSTYIGASGWLNCTLPNETGRQFLIKHCVSYDVNNTRCTTTDVRLGSGNDIGQGGLFWAVLLIVVLGVLGFLFAGTTGGFLIIGVGFILLGVSGIWLIGYGIGAATILLAGITAYTTRS